MLTQTKLHGGSSFGHMIVLTPGKLLKATGARPKSVGSSRQLRIVIIQL